MTENVNHPAHYRKPGRKECIYEMLDIFGPVKVAAFCELCAHKYRYRYADKGGMEDLAKATWYKNFLESLKADYPEAFAEDAAGGAARE